MRYTTTDYTELKLLKKQQDFTTLRRLAKEALENYEETQEWFNKLENDAYEESPYGFAVLPKVDILIDNLRNIENYIREISIILGIIPRNLITDESKDINSVIELKNYIKPKKQIDLKARMNSLKKNSLLRKKIVINL